MSGPATSTQQHDTYMPPYLLINKNALLAAGDTNPKNASGIYKDAHNERAQRQEEIERRLVGQLGERFKNAQLLEVSEGSYLIQNQIKLPIFGKSIAPITRTKSSISKRAFLLNSGAYNTNLRKYVLDKNRSLYIQEQMKNEADG